MKYRENISAIKVVKEIVINWHITEACNYNCQYCYSKWRNKCDRKELIHQPDKALMLLKKLYDFFKPENINNPLRQKMVWKSVRLNFAGGETLLYKEKAQKLITQAKEIGFNVSLITNGSTLSTEFISALAPQLSILGVSLDSNNISTNNLIGRIDNKGNMLNTETLVDIVDTTRVINPDIKIKLNTVVNELNYQEDMNSIISKLHPDKWKVLQVLPILTDKLSISGSKFQRFIRSHQNHKRIMSIEDNQGMQGSYIMVDPLGRFYQNDKSFNAEYFYSPPIIKAGVGHAFSEVDFSIEKFSNRYPQAKTTIIR